jgi:hypothetical protein
MGPTGNTGPTGAPGPTGATGATGDADTSYAVSETNVTDVPLTDADPGAGELPQCQANDSEAVTIELPVSPGGITGDYSVFITGSASFSSSGPTTLRTTSLEIVVDGVALSPMAYATSSRSDDLRNVTVSFVKGGLDGASPHTIELVGCADANDVTIPQNFGVLSVIATG